MAEVGDREPLSWDEWVPERWFQSREQSSVWVRGYRSFRITTDRFTDGPLIRDIEDVRVVILYGALSYSELVESGFRHGKGNSILLQSGRAEARSTEIGTYLILLAPYVRDGAPGDEPATRSKLQEVEGLLLALYGRNVVYEKLFDFELLLGDYRHRPRGPGTITPTTLDAPDITDARLDLLDATAATKNSLTETDTNRVELAARWLEAAEKADAEIAFVSYCIALETLVGKEKVVPPLRGILARVYERPADRGTEDHFLLNRLIQLRGRVVHNGERFPLDFRLRALVPS